MGKFNLLGRPHVFLWLLVSKFIDNPRLLDNNSAQSRVTASPCGPRARRNDGEMDYEGSRTDDIVGEKPARF